MQQYKTPAEIRQAELEGEITALECHILLKQLEDEVKAQLEDIRPLVRQSAERIITGKEKAPVLVLGMEVKLAETGSKWDYSGCGCARLAALQKRFDEAKAALENRQKYLQGLTDPERNIDPETGEPTEGESGYPEWVTRAVKTSTSFVTISKPKTK